jgi:hypothetical protein
MPDAQFSAMPDHRPEPPKEPARPGHTPGTDMQAEDTGTSESGQPEGRGTPAEPAMKQTSKTESESGSRG